MMVGHAALAFAIAAWAVASLGVPRERALLLGAAAGTFAVVPDVDMGYAVVGVTTAVASGTASFPETFWAAGNVVHRGLTHSLVVGAFAATLFGLAATRSRARAVAVAGLASAVLVTFLTAGALEAGVMASFALAGVVVALLFARAGLGPQAVLAAALVGVLSHPFGDVFTGTTPTLLYPFDVRVLPELIELSPDPTVHLLAAFGIELATVWLAVAVYLRLRGLSLRGHVHRRSVLGAGYVGMALVLPPPTLAASYQFVFSVLAVSLVGVSADLPTPDLRSLESRLAVGLTGLAAVTIAWLAYAAGYLVVG